MTTTRSDALACHVCGAPGLALIPTYQKLSRVTSDCKVWPAGGQLGVCRQCGCAQAVLDTQWHRDADAIYSSYALYHQSQGAEQNVFDPVSGKPASRSDSLSWRLKSENLLPARGRMMDFGCGTGSLLRSFGAIFQEWTLAGLEISDARRQQIESIERVERLFTPPMANVPGAFDLITMIHSLEHIESPVNCLVEIREKLKPGGLLLIQVPDCAANPFSFLIADHSSHFCLPVLQRVVQHAGYEIVLGTNQWVAKELTVIGRKALSGSTGDPPVPSGDSPDGIRVRTSPRPTELSSIVPVGGSPALPSNFWTAEGCMDAASLSASVAWLEHLASEARALSSRKPFGLFGTSIAGAFLAGELGDAVDFFVDEDPNRQGKIWCGHPIYPPSQVPSGGHVFLGLAPVAAAKVLARLNSLRLPAHFYPPPPLPNVPA